MKQRQQSKAKEEQARRDLYEAILTLRTPFEIAQFFEDLLTPAERQAMTDRWQVVAPLQAGVPYRTVHEQTGVSVTTISRVARCLALGGGYQLAYQRLKERKAQLSEGD